jgi:hypothetical protein
LRELRDLDASAPEPEVADPHVVPEAARLPSTVHWRGDAGRSRALLRPCIVGAERGRKIDASPLVRAEVVAGGHRARDLTTTALGLDAERKKRGIAILFGFRPGSKVTCPARLRRVGTYADPAGEFT